MLSLFLAPVARAAPCETDPALERAAKRLLKADAQPDSTELMTAVREAGSEAIPVYARFGPAIEQQHFQQWLSGIKKESQGPLVCGRATDGKRAMWVAGVLNARLTVLPSHEVRFSLEKGLSDPRLVIRDDSGSITDLPLPQGRGAQTARLPTGLTHPLLLQLIATGKHGPLPVAERWIGGSPTLGPDDIDRTDPNLWVQALREARKVDALRTNRLLAEVALAHANKVCEAGKVAHEVEPHQDPQARLERRGIIARAVGEAVARGKDPEDTMRSLERSPSHFDTLTDARFTDVGVGIASDKRGRACLVVLLAAWPRLTR